MLSLISPAEAAPSTRALTRTGTSVWRGCGAVPGARSVEAAIGRPAAAAVVFARPRPQASTGFVLKSQPVQKQSSHNYTHATRVAIAFGGGVGPYPARDPV